MRLRSVLVLLALLGGVLGLASGCDSYGCRGLACGCYTGYDCVQSCGPGPCELDCASFQTECRSTCVDDCVVGCHDGPTCRTSCGDRCNVSCDHVSSCATSCGANCQYDCTSVSSCAPRVGTDSEVYCQSVGSCDVTCDGTCRVHCLNTGSCDVFCPSGVAKTPCADGFVCGEAC